MTRRRGRGRCRAARRSARTRATAVGHCLQVVGDTLFTDSSDNTVRSWSVSSGAPIRTYAGHSGWVYCLQVVGDTLFTGSYDKTARSWSVSSGAPIRTYAGHSDAVGACRWWAIRCSRALVTRRRGRGRCRAARRSAYTGHSRAVRCLQVVGDTLITGSYDNGAVVVGVERRADPHVRGPQRWVFACRWWVIRCSRALVTRRRAASARRVLRSRGPA